MSSSRPSAARWLLAPWWGLELFSSAKSFVDNPVIGSERLNRRGLHVARMRWADRLTEQRRARLAPLVAAEDRATFQRDGVVMRRNVLPLEEFEALRREVLQLQAPAREMLQGDTITRRIALEREALARCPSLAHLLNSPLWQGLTQYVAGYHRPAWAYVQTILNHVCDAAPDPQTNLHADTFHPTMKAWYFLTDVAADEGAFCYVPGSHRLTSQRLAWEEAKSISAHSDADRYSARGSFRINPSELPGLNLPPPQLYAVPANTLVVADTRGFHARGPSARPSTRIEIWGYDRRNPFLPWTTDGLWAAMGLTGRRASLYWQALDTLERWGGRRNPWRAAGIKTPDAADERKR